MRECFRNAIGNPEQRIDRDGSDRNLILVHKRTPYRNALGYAARADGLRKGIRRKASVIDFDA